MRKYTNGGKNSKRGSSRAVINTNVLIGSGFLLNMVKIPERTPLKVKITTRLSFYARMISKATTKMQLSPSTFGSLVEDAHLPSCKDKRASHMEVEIGGV